jgi:hypothetical protein
MFSTVFVLIVNINILDELHNPPIPSCNTVPSYSIIYSFHMLQKWKKHFRFNPNHSALIRVTIKTNKQQLRYRIFDSVSIILILFRITASYFYKLD